ncbi:MATE family efflux transporter [uncultured Bilophila sp.]|uniref:MATE family efflux transporter n=1 Tax=uncultured Bilophila sp. TaxID=529385 RepID=UPI00280B6EAA|nr:MATE family efflux transporter [uncultured Bilophila sp.]
MATGICLACFGSQFRLKILRVMQTPQHLMEPSGTFLRIYLWTLPGQYLLAVTTAILRAVRSVRVALFVTLATGFLNICGDFAFGLGW